MVERLNGIQEVAGSTPTISTIKPLANCKWFFNFTDYINILLYYHIIYYLQIAIHFYRFFDVTVKYYFTFIDYYTPVAKPANSIHIMTDV